MVRWTQFLVGMMSLVTVLVVYQSSALASPCTLHAVYKADKAKIKVYFTKFLQEDNSGGRYKACKIVSRADKDTVTFFITPFRQDATVVVHKSNWP
jgi:hypothetical protein